ncbi:MAG: hypothetical protein AMXMBFR57_15550 [Acidimicrobiia bacterium]
MPLMHDAVTLWTVRRLLLALLLFGLIGTTSELWLIGHHEDVWQWAPLLVMTLSVAATAWVLAGWSSSALAVHRILMAVLLVTGVIGAVMHYRANMEFQLEMDPSLSGLALMAEVLHAKAPPALAPGNMALLALLGLVAGWRASYIRSSAS